MHQNGEKLPNGHNTANLTSSIPNGRKTFQIYPHFPFQGPPKFTQIWLFGSKMNHLANLLIFVPDR
jgi:hypothetical protein